jgi:hypothetical protein
MSVCAEMLTLVAVRMVPMKTPTKSSRIPEECRSRGAAGEREHDAAERGPERDAAHPPHLGHVGLETGDEHQQDDADVGHAAHEPEQRFLDGLVVQRRIDGHERLPAEDVEDGGPEDEPGEHLAEDGRLADAIGRGGSQLGRGNDQAPAGGGPGADGTLLPSALFCRTRQSQHNRGPRASAAGTRRAAC